MNNNIDLNTDMKSLDSGDFQHIKPLIMLFYKRNDVANKLTNVEKALLDNLEVNNYDLYVMLNTFRGLLKLSNQTEKDICATIYLTFRKVYIGFNQKQQELKSNNINGELNETSYKNFEDIVSVITYLNNKFTDTKNLKSNQYYKLNTIQEFKKKTQKALEYSNDKDFPNELEKLNTLTPLIKRYIRILSDNIDIYLLKVNKICNNTQMTQELFDDYQKSCKAIKYGLELLTEDFKTP